MINFEKKVNTQFNSNIKVALKLINSKSNSFDVIQKILNFLKTFNNDLITLSKDDYINLFNDNTSNRLMTENKINVSDKILILDYFNIINVHELSYILLNETKCNSIYNHDNENITNFLKENSKNSINKVFNQNFEIKVELSRNLLNRTSLTLGEDETEKIINNYNRSKELSVLKYSMEYKNLINDLNNKITNCFKNIKENFNFVLEISNYNYLIRNKISNKDICLLRLNLNFPNYNKIKFNEMYDLVDYLYIFRNKKKLIKQEIKKELIILKEESEKIILEGIEDEINKINENIKDLEFVNSFLF